MKPVVRIMMLMLALFWVAACQQQAEQPAPSADLAGTSWTLSSLNGNPALAETAVTLEFSADGSVSGTDGCNRFNAPFTQDGANLTINSQTGISSMMMCPEPVMDQAAAYMAALASVSSFTTAGNQLSLQAGEQVVATFVSGVADAAPAPLVATLPEVAVGGDLAGTGWVLSSLNGALPISGTSVSMQFGADGALTGTDGCNQFNTTFTQNGSNLTISPMGASTMIACPEPVMEQAAAFSAALASATSFTLADNVLALQSGGQVLATFVFSSTDLAGTFWEVVSYNNGREAVVGLIAGTELYVNFGLEGDLTGNAGCNQFFTGFTAADNTIEIEPPGATRRFCSEPPGIMDQEQEFLSALESAATYSIRGNLLEMRTAADQLAVIMTRKLILELPEPEAAAPRGQVLAPQGLNVRSGPGVNFPIIGMARNGAEGEIVGRSSDGRWWAAVVPFAPNGVGWVSADFVLASNTENVPVIEVPPPVIVVPTAAPTPTPPPPTPMPEISFGADRTTINQGECTTLRWNVQNIQAVWVYPLGEQFERFPRTGQGTEQVCPTQTTTYEMRVLQRDGTVIFRQVTINVSGGTVLTGTRWEVANFNNGRDALVSLLPGTRITLEFGANGQLTGNSGCNTFSTSYQVSGNSLTIGPPGGTQTFCGEPEGIMQQETDFLNILRVVTTFRLDGNRLELRFSGEQIAVIANRMP
jgi:heat shock protein HslJ